MSTDITNLDALPELEPAYDGTNRIPGLEVRRDTCTAASHTKAVR